MSNHTPGPWRVYENDIGIGVTPVSTSPDVADLSGLDGGRPIEVTRANARLMAASPEMLAALKLAIPHLEENYRWHRDMQSPASKVMEAHAAFEAANRVITKAEGQS